MRGQGLIFRNGPESLGRYSGPTRSGEGASALGGGIDDPLRVVVTVIVIVVVIMVVIMTTIMGEMSMNVIHDWCL
jgi:hypothetical protein